MPGTFGRNLRLYLWKNSLQKKRAPMAACCEICTPVVFVALMALLYHVSTVTNVETQSFPEDMEGITMFPFAVLPHALSRSNQVLGMVGSDDLVDGLLHHVSASTRRAHHRATDTPSALSV